MNSETLLLRQVHPHWVKEDGSVASPAFWPFPKDQNMLSTDDGDHVTSQDSWKRFTRRPDCKSAGVWGILVQEATACQLDCVQDPMDDNPFHVLVDFSAHAEKQQKARAKILSAKANARGNLFSPTGGPG